MNILVNLLIFIIFTSFEDTQLTPTRTAQKYCSNIAEIFHCKIAKIRLIAIRLIELYIDMSQYNIYS